MSIKVVRGSVDTGGRVYLPGESISGLSKKDEKELVDLGVCRYAEDEVPEMKNPQDDIPEGLTKLKGGFYGLPNGDKVRGLPAAIAALEELNAADDNKEDEDPDDEEPDGEGKGPNTELPIE